METVQIFQKKLKELITEIYQIPKFLFGKLNPRMYIDPFFGVIK